MKNSFENNVIRPISKVGVLMIQSIVGRVGGLLLLALICTSCGDTFRPVATPISPPPPDPSSFHYVLVISSNGPSNPGSSTRIDVSGDTNAGVAKLGLGPVHAALLPNAGRIYVANSLEDTVSSYSPTDVTAITTVSLPPSAVPVFVHTTQNDTVYVASGDAIPGNTGTVSAISTSSNVISSTIPVGTNPVALAETPNGKKLYVANQGSGSVTSINTIDKTVNATIPTGTSPVWAVARSDSARVYVLNQGSGTISSIDTSSEAFSNVSVGSGGNFMLYDKGRNRLYVTNPGAHTLSILDAAVDPPALLATIDLTAGTTPACPVACAPVSVAVLPDGSRAYVVSYVPGSDPLSSQVTVIDTQSFTVRKVIPLSAVNIDSVNPTGCSTARFRLFTVASSDGSRVFVSNCDAGGTKIILTITDSLVPDFSGNPLQIPAPSSSFAPPNVGEQPPPQNPVFILAGP
jgi:YVTN family beta-propeller protein